MHLDSVLSCNNIIYRLPSTVHNLLNTIQHIISSYRNTVNEININDIGISGTGIHSYQCENFTYLNQHL